AGGVAAHNRSTIRLTCNELSVGDGWRTVSIATQKVCTWSSVICADMPHHLADVRFTPKSGHSFSVLGCPLCAMCGRISTPPDCTWLTGFGATVTTADVYPAS